MPASAAAVFGDRLPFALRYVDHLCGTGVSHGLIGPREVPRIWTRHVLNCAVLEELVPADACVIDVGSGAGLPGLAVALARPDLRITLVEPLERRVTWLRTVVADLELDVRIVRARAEDLRGAEHADVATARAVAPLQRLAEWSMPLLRGGGQLLAIKGRTAQREVEACVEPLRDRGVTKVEVVTCGAAHLEEATTVVRARVGATGYSTAATGRAGGSRRSPAPGGRPRRAGRPTRDGRGKRG